MSEVIQTLNQILQMVDTKAAELKDGYYELSPAKKAAGKKLVLDLIQNGLDLCQKVQPTPKDTIDDLLRLQKQIDGLF